MALINDRTLQVVVRHRGKGEVEIHAGSTCVNGAACVVTLRPLEVARLLDSLRDASKIAMDAQECPIFIRNV